MLHDRATTAPPSDPRPHATRRGARLAALGAAAALALHCGARTGLDAPTRTDWHRCWSSLRPQLSVDAAPACVFHPGTPSLVVERHERELRTTGVSVGSSVVLGWRGADAFYTRPLGLDGAPRGEPARLPFVPAADAGGTAEAVTTLMLQSLCDGIMANGSDSVHGCQRFDLDPLGHLRDARTLVPDSLCYAAHTTPVGYWLTLLDRTLSQPRALGVFSPHDEFEQRVVVGRIDVGEQRDSELGQAVLDDGTFALAVRAPGPLGGSTTDAAYATGITVQRFDATGAPVGDAQVVVPAGVPADEFRLIAVPGGALAAWLQGVPAAARRPLMIEPLGPDAAPRGAPAALDGATDATSFLLRVAVRTVVALWITRDGAVALRSLTPDGRANGAVVPAPPFADGYGGVDDLIDTPAGVLAVLSPSDDAPPRSIALAFTCTAP